VHLFDMWLSAEVASGLAFPCHPGALCRPVAQPLPRIYKGLKCVHLHLLLSKVKPQLDRGGLGAVLAIETHAVIVDKSSFLNLSAFIALAESTGDIVSIGAMGVV